MMEPSVVSALARLGYEEITSTEELSGGSVHHIYRITDRDHGTVVVKWRSGSAKEATGIPISSDEIVREAEGLRFFAGSRAVVPSLYGVDQESGVLVMSEIVPQGTNLKAWIAREGMISIDAIFDIYRSVDELLSWGRLREPGSASVKEDGLFSQLVMERFRYQEQTVVRQLLSDLRADTEHRAFIMGGLSFKNILYDGASHGFCDLETFCYGHPLFDLGYFLGHALLHLAEDRHSLTAFFTGLPALLQSSRSINSSEEDLLVRILTLTILYRLTHPLIPYAFPGRERLMNQIPALKESLRTDRGHSIANLKAVIEST